MVQPGRGNGKGKNVLPAMFVMLWLVIEPFKLCNCTLNTKLQDMYRCQLKNLNIQIQDLFLYFLIQFTSSLLKNVELLEKDISQQDHTRGKNKTAMVTMSFTMVLWQTWRKLTKTLKSTSMLNVRYLASLKIPGKFGAKKYMVKFPCSLAPDIPEYSGRQ